MHRMLKESKILSIHQKKKKISNQYKSCNQSFQYKVDFYH